MFAEVFSYDQELFDSGEALGFKKGIELGIIGAFQLLVSVGTERADIKRLIIQKYKLTEVEAMQYIEKCCI